MKPTQTEGQDGFLSVDIVYMAENPGEMPFRTARTLYTREDGTMFGIFAFPDKSRPSTKTFAREEAALRAYAALLAATLAEEEGAAA